MPLKYKKIIVSASLSLLVLLSSGKNLPAQAESYIFDETQRTVEAPDAVRLTRVIDGEYAGTKPFSSPRDVFMTSDGTLYVADTGNSRIVVLSEEGKFLREFSGYTENGKLIGFSEPCGIHVDKDGTIYVADSKAAAVVHFGQDGELIKKLLAPSAETLPENFYFKPTKIAVDNHGRIFVVSEGFTMGVLEFDTEGRFLQHMGAPTVAVSPIELLWRRFMTKEQRERTVQNVPTEYNNITPDEQGFLFVTTSAYEYWQYKAGKIQPLRKLNAKGIDVLVRNGQPVGDVVFPEKAGRGVTYYGPSSLVDCCLMDSGDYAILDQKRGRVFAYTSDGELMYTFGSPGDYSGSLMIPTALVYYRDSFYITDAMKNAIYQFSLTEYGSLFSKVSRAKAAIDYDSEERLWNQILKENVNCRLAIRGLGMAAYRQRNMKEAMSYFIKAGDRENYSKAYAFVRRSWIQEHSVLLLCIIIAGIAALMILSRIKKRIRETADKTSFRASLLYSGHICFHPLDGFWDLKRENRGNMKAALCLLVLACITTVVSDLGTGFIFNKNNLQTYSMAGAVFQLLLAFGLWCVSQWCVTALMEGEGKLRDIVIATCYAFTPYIILQFIAMGLSNFMILTEGDLHSVILTISYLWLAFLLVMSVKQTHDYSMAKTLLVIAIVFVVILLIVFVAMLLLALYQQIIAFVRDIYDEITLRF